jgi:calcineurin-like phosphoesterase family protein
MNKKLKFNTQQQGVFFSSDFHAFHNPSWPVPIWKMRGYESWQEMNEDILDKVNARVKPNDILFFLGDFALNSTPEQVEEFLSQIKCNNIHKIFGNHCSSTIRIYDREIMATFGQKIEVYPFKYKNLVFCGNHLEVSINKQHIILSHFPFRVFNRSHHGSWALSGHSHYSDKERRADYPIGKTLDVGWDGKNDIYSFEEIKEIMDKKSIHQVDHHDETVN